MTVDAPTVSAVTEVDDAAAAAAVVSAGAEGRWSKHDREHPFFFFFFRFGFV